MRKGLLTVIDGIDGSGKTTQIKLLAKALKEQKVLFEIISFPRYKDNIFGKLIKKYLEGKFGSISQVNPYLISLAYAGDRDLAKPLIERWLSEGKVVIANRYVSASKAHLGANLQEEKREEFFKWLDELEYKINGIPKEDLTILLKVDPQLGQNNASGKHHDIHEENLRHLELAYKIYLLLAKRANNWYVVDCMESAQMKAPEEIHQTIIGLLQKKIHDKS